MTIPYAPEELAEVRPLLDQLRRHGSKIVDGMGETVLTFNSGVWEDDPSERLLEAIPRLLATIEDRDQEIARLRNGLTEVIDCSSGSNPEEIMAGIARRTLKGTRDLRG